MNLSAGRDDRRLGDRLRPQGLVEGTIWSKRNALCTPHSFWIGPPKSTPLRDKVRSDHSRFVMALERLAGGAGPREEESGVGAVLLQ